MPCSVLGRPSRRLRWISPVLLLILVLTTGCVSDQDYREAIAEYRQASNSLARSFRMLIESANTVESGHFIDTQTFERAQIGPRAIDSQRILSPEQLRLRVDAIHALSDYNLALATLASGRDLAKMQAASSKASASLATLSTDAQAASGQPSSGNGLGGVVSSAASAAGEVLRLIEARRSRAEIRESVRKNDPALSALYKLLGDESAVLYERERSALGARGTEIFSSYNREVVKPNADLSLVLRLGDRIKQQRRAEELLALADPAPAIAAFAKSHDALVAVLLAPKKGGPHSLGELISSARDFADEVQPLGESVGALVAAL